MNHQQEIHRAACQLAAENKTPSVALIKAKLSTNAPLAMIIKGVKYWQSNPEPLKDVVETRKETKKPVLSEELLVEIQKAVNVAVAPLQKEIEQLKEILNQSK